MKRSWPLAVLGAGLLILVIGFGYDLAFAGIPYPDPSPELAARYRLHSRVASILEGVGGAFVLLGLLAGCAVALWSALRRRGSA